MGEQAQLKCLYSPGVHLEVWFVSVFRTVPFWFFSYRRAPAAALSNT